MQNEKWRRFERDSEREGEKARVAVYIRAQNPEAISSIETVEYKDNLRHTRPH